MNHLAMQWWNLMCHMLIFISHLKFIHTSANAVVNFVNIEAMMCQLGVLIRFALVIGNMMLTLFSFTVELVLLTNNIVSFGLVAVLPQPVIFLSLPLLLLEFLVFVGLWYCYFVLEGDERAGGLANKLSLSFSLCLHPEFNYVLLIRLLDAVVLILFIYYIFRNCSNIILY